MASMSRGPGWLADADPRPATAAPMLSVRRGTGGSEAPNSTSGSSSSADDNNSVGINPESEGAPGTADVLAPGEVVELDDAGGASGPMSRSTPCASKSSSDSIGAVGGVDAGPAVAEGRAPPTCDAVPFNPKGSSTGRSAKGSKAGREAASIVFEPDSVRSILKVSCSAAGEVPRRWLTDRRASPGFVTPVTFRARKRPFPPFRTVTSGRVFCRHIPSTTVKFSARSEVNLQPPLGYPF